MNISGSPGKLSLAFLILCVSALLCDAQVTFSKDWNAGKRSIETDLHSTLKSATALCHLMVNQIKKLADCESRLDDIDSGPSPIYTGRR